MARRGGNWLHDQKTKTYKMIGLMSLVIGKVNTFGQYTTLSNNKHGKFCCLAKSSDSRDVLVWSSANQKAEKE